MFCILTPDIFLTCRVEPGTDCKNEPKFIVFYTALLNIFSIFFFMCKTDSPRVSMKRNRTMVTVKNCKSCTTGFTWKNQPLANLSCWKYVVELCDIDGIGASISKILLVFKHFGMQAYEARKFFHHQTKFILPYITTGNHIGWH